MTLGASFDSQRSCQNFALWPFPISTTVAARKSCLSISSQDTSVPIHGLELFFHLYQYHIHLRAQPNFWIWEIPNPPSFFGRQTLSHLIKQCPPLACSLPFHRKDRLILSIFFFAHFTRGKIGRLVARIVPSSWGLTCPPWIGAFLSISVVLHLAFRWGVCSEFS